MYLNAYSLKQYKTNKFCKSDHEIIFSLLVCLHYAWEENYLIYGLTMLQAKIFVLLLCSQAWNQESSLIWVCRMRTQIYHFQKQLGSRSSDSISGSPFSRVLHINCILILLIKMSLYYYLSTTSGELFSSMAI